MSSCATVLSRFPFSFIHIPASNCRTLFLYKNTLPNTSITLLFVSLLFLSGQLKFNPKVQNSDAEQTEILSGETQMQHFRLPQQKQRHENENKTDIKSFHRTRVGKNRYYRSEKEQARWRFKPKKNPLEFINETQTKAKEEEWQGEKHSKCNRKWNALAKQNSCCHGKSPPNEPRDADDMCYGQTPPKPLPTKHTPPTPP